MTNSSAGTPIHYSTKSITRELLRVPVLVAALGYMVDMYDLFLFSIVWVPSLKSLNLAEDSIMKGWYYVAQPANGRIAYWRNCVGHTR